MTKPEMNRRIATIPADVLTSAYKDIIDGNGAHTVSLTNQVTLKQANALCEWHSRYGGIYPSAGVQS